MIGLDDAAIGAISVCGPIERLGPERVHALAPRVREAAATASALMREAADPRPAAAAARLGRPG